MVEADGVAVVQPPMPETGELVAVVVPAVSVQAVVSCCRLL